MAAIVSGSSLGLLNSSLYVLGSQGAVGQSTQGRGGDQVYINAATGNLVIQNGDESLVGRGLDLNVLRTYNSQGLLNDDNGDNWRLGVYRKVYALTGTVNTAGSTVTRVAEDGSESVYTYDTTQGKYVCHNGAGAYETLSFDSPSQTWTWTDGSTHLTERYDAANGGRITQAQDQDGNGLTFTYNASGLITQVSDASGETTFLDYTGTNLTDLRTVNSSGQTTERTRYAYDASNRLITVTTDLSPSDASVADGNVYVVNYSYDGTSKRVATLTQTDGNNLTFSYVQVGSAFKLASYTDATGKITAFNYVAGRTDIIDPLGLVTSLYADAQGELTQIQSAAVGGVRQSVSYAYNANGDVTQVTDAKGQVTSYGYDANGNRTLERDAAGNTITRVFGANNALLAETSYVVPDPDGAGAGQPATPLTTRYAYDSLGHLRFVISTEGRVTEYRYNSFGQRIASIEYTGSVYDLTGLTPTSTLTEAQLVTYVNAADKTRTERVDSTYDFRGQLATTTSYASVDASGNGVLDGNQSVTHYTYDQAGKLLNTLDGRGSSSTYVYDGLGRLASSTDATGKVTLTQYDDANRKTTITSANGLVTTSTYDARGELVSVMQSSGGTSLGTTSYFYDADGRLRRTVDPTGVSSHILYDEAGRKIATIDGNGTLTEYRYDADNNLTRTIEYATAVSAAGLASLSDAQGNPTSVALATIRPAATGQDRSTWNAYDSANHLVKSVDELGYVTQNFYDGAGRLTDTVKFATAVGTATLGDTPAATSINPATNAQDRLTRNFYDGDGKLRGTLDGEGYLDEYKYDAAGQLVETVGYATATDASLRTSGTLAQLLQAPVAANNAKDIHSYTLYNARAQAVGAVDGEGYFTETTYDAAGNKANVIRYATKVMYSAGATVASLRAGALNLPGTIGSYASTPDGAANSVTGDLDLRAWIAPTDWTPSALEEIIDKSGTDSSQFSYLLRLNPDGTLNLYWSSNGTTLSSATSTSAVGAVDGTAKWVRATLTVNNGAGGRDVKFYTSDDGTTWTQLGSTVTTAGATSVFDGTAPLRIGVRDDNLISPFSGKIYYAEVRNGINGTVVAKFNPAANASAAGASSFTSSTGEVWTLAGAATLGIASAQDQVTTFTYTALNQLASETDPEGTLTQYTYDEVGNLTQTSKAVNTTDVRGLTAQYDKQGRLTAQLSGNGVAQLTSAATQADIDAVWTAYATHYTYDAAGRKTSATDANGWKTLYYYDADGRLNYTINQLGEVTQAAYNVLGELTGTVRYGTRLSSTTLQTLSNAGGGLVNSTVTSAVAGIANAAFDSATTYTYTSRGQVASTTDPLLFATTETYDAFGDVIASSQQIGSGQTLDHSYTFDRRGLLTQTVWDPAAIATSQSTAYDAFGRAIQTTDARGNVSTQTYDRLGRVVATVIDPGTGHLNIGTTTTFDAFDRVLTQTDALGNTTAYSYNTANRSVTVTTPEGVVVTTVKNRLGDTQSITDGLGNTTTYAYDRDGNLISVDSPTGTSAKFYDKTDLLTRSVDAAGTATVYAYDTAGRVLTRTVDPGHLNLVTTYAYDAKGQNVSVTDPDGTVTQTQFDLKGQMTSVIVDPGAGHLNLTTTYVYDGRGKKLSVTEGAGSSNPKVTQYAYDKLGRLLTQRVDPNGVNATTTYTYDKNNNVATKTDADGNVTRYAYDADDRLVYTIDPMGGVAKNDYDADGHVVRTTAYAAPLSAAALAALPAVPSISDIHPQAGPTDEITGHVYDKDGREKYVIRAVDASTGYVTQKDYDANGNVIRTVAYAAAIPMSTPLTKAQFDAALASQQGSAANSLTRTVYDAANRAAYQIDGANYVKEIQYDGDGRVLKTILYTQPVSVGPTPTMADMAAVATAADTQRQINSFHYDAAGRMDSSTDAEGFTETYAYDAAGNKTGFTNKKGATWTYVYDAAGRMTAEISPQVPVTSVNSTTLAPTTTMTSVTTSIAYDALGNVVSRTEGVGTLNADGTSAARTTTYVYDALGRQTKTVFPQVNVYNSSADNLSTNGINGTVAVTETPGVAPETNVTFDALGNATVNRDSAGDYSYKVYDALGRVVYDIDALGYVTQYAYDAFGNQTAVTRYATALNLGAHTAGTSFSGSAVTALLATSPLDRTINTSYDLVNRAKQVQQPQALVYEPTAPSGQQTFQARATTNETYNAFGQVVKESVVRNPATGVSEDTYYYYDARGNKTAQVDALGYLTTWQYDENGDVLKQVEYAKALTAGSWSVSGYAAPVATTPQSSPGDPAGYDREVDTTYDRKNEKTSETRVDSEFGTLSGALVLGTTTGNLTTTYGYDAVGNVTSVTDPTGATTYTYYDALGRTVATAAPARFSGTSSGTVPIPPVYQSYDPNSNTVSINFAKNNPAGTTVAFQYKSPEESAWRPAVALQVSADGATYTGVLSGLTTSGHYVYQITYTRNGDSTPYATGTGDLNVLGPSSVASANIAAVVEQPALTFSQTNSAGMVTQYVDNGEGGYDPNTYWNTTNTVALSWSSLNSLGNGAVRVHINYTTYLYQANSDGEGGYGTPYIVGSASAFQDHTYTNAADVATGVNYSWGEGLPAASNFSAGIASISSVQVYKVVDGQEILVFNSASNLTQQPDRLLIRGKTAGLTSINVGGTTLAANSLGAGVYSVSLASLSRGTYSFTTNGTATQFSGTFEVTHSSTTTHAGVQEINPLAINRRLEAFNLPSSAATVVLQYRLAGDTGVYLSKTVTRGADGLFTVGYDDVANGNYEYVLTVTDLSGNAVDLSASGGTAGGTLSGTLTVDRGGVLPTVSQGANAQTITPLTVTRYNAFGNVVQTTQYAKGASSADAHTYGVPTADAADQTTSNFYDSHGDLIRSVDPEGASMYRSYDILGHVAKSWQPITDNDGLVNNAVQVFQYDKLGHQIATLEPSYHLNQSLAPAAVPATWHLASVATYATDENGFNWSGTNVINMSWNSIASWGPGNVTARVYYVTGGGVSTYRDFTVTAASAPTGAALSWVDPGSYGVDGGIQYVSSVQLWMPDAATSDKFVQYPTTLGTQAYAISMTGVQPGTGIDFKYTPAGQSSWASLPFSSPMSGWYEVNAGALSGAYNFEIVYTNPGDSRASTHVQGTFTVSGGVVTSLVYGNSSASGYSLPALDPATFTTTQAQYDAFGEITAKGVNGLQEYYDYDNAGHLWRTNQNGVNEVFLYDAQGKATADIQSQQLDLKASYTSADQVAALTSSVQRTNTTYDMLERAVAQSQQTFTVDHSLDVIPSPVTMPQMSLSFGVAQAGGPDGEGGYTPTIVNLGWNDISSWGGGDLTVTLNYNVYSYQITGSDGEGGYTYGWVSVPASSPRSFTVSASSAATGTSVSWSGEYFCCLNSVTVSKKDVSNQTNITLFSQSHSGASGNAIVLDAPAEPDAQVTVRWKPSGSGSSWPFSATPANFGNKLFFDTRGIAAGSYDYEILYNRPGQAAYAHKTGTFTVGAAPGITDTTQAGVANVPVTSTTGETLDRWGNALSVTDARGYTTNYRYNDLNETIEEKKPTVDVWGANGIDTLSRPTTHTYYDKAGRTLGTIDANGNVNTEVYDAAGQLVTENHADGGTVSYQYDAFGRRTRAIDAIGNPTDYVYDRDNRVTKEKHPLSEDDYAYDQAGNRIRVTDGAGEVTQYWYDTRGKVLRTQLPLGQRTLDYYDARGNKIREINADGDQMTWTYDYFGRLTAHTDLGGALTTEVYDKAGHVQSSTTTRNGTSWTTGYTYYENGLLKTIADPAVQGQTYYEYDAAGNRVRERYIKAGVLYQDDRVTFDALNRMSAVTDNRESTTFAYDANGNRRSVHSDYYGATGTAQQHLTSWYLYDSMNRITLSQGSLLNGAVQITSGVGVQLQYDGAGNRRVATTMNASNALVSESYNYDSNGRLTTTNIAGVTTSSRAYDNAGRVVGSTSFSSPGVISERRTNSYNADGELLSQKVFTGTASTPSQTTTYNLYDAVGNVLNYQIAVTSGSPYTNYYSYQYAKYDGYKESVVHGSSTLFQPGNTTTSYDFNGNVTGVTDQFAANKSRTFVTDGSGQILQKTENGQTQYYFYAGGNPIGSSGALSPADFDYNYTPVSDQYPGTAPGSYVVSQGDTLRRISLTVFGDAQLWYLIADANGLHSDSDLKVGQQLTIPNRVSNIHNDFSTFKVVGSGDIIGDTTPTLPDPPPPPPPSHGGCGGLGLALMVIVAVVVTIYTAGAAAELMSASLSTATGGFAATTTATSMGAWAAGTAALGGSMGGLGIVAAAVGGAVGSIASQEIGRATGNVDHFSWGQVGVAAIGAGVTAGMGAMGSAGAAGQMGLESGGNAALAVNAAAGNIVTQEVSRATGYQSSFNWRSVAVSAIAAPLANEVANGIQGDIGYDDFGNSARTGTAFSRMVGDAGAKLTTSLVSGVATQWVRSMVYGGGKVDFSQIAADSFGNLVGNSIADDLASAGMRQAAELANIANMRQQVDALNERIAGLSETDYLESAQLEKARDALTNALISNDVYSDQTNPDLLPTGVRRLSNDDVRNLTDKNGVALGLDPDNFNKSGYFGALYRNDITGSYIYANRGTEVGKGDDWWNNLTQEFGFPAPQYKQAVDVARQLYSALDGDVTFTGHSLGGGMASAQALSVIGGRATTFNAAGLSEGTIDRYSLDTTNADQRVTAFYVNGEIVSRLQDNPVFDVAAGYYGTIAKNALAVVGVVGDLVEGERPDSYSFGLAYVPEAVGTRVALPALNAQGEELGVLGRLGNTVSLHSIGSVLQSIQNQYNSVLGNGAQ
jgi:YD repeat-containing protein